MSYFDDPKKKAAWDKELDALKKEKAARAGRASAADTLSAEPQRDMAQAAERSAAYESAPTRERISYVQLLMEENMAVQAKKTMTAERTLEKEVSFEM